VTLHEAIKAADELAAEGIKCSCDRHLLGQALDYDTLAEASVATGGRLIVARIIGRGGIGEASSAPSLTRTTVRA